MTQEAKPSMLMEKDSLPFEKWIFRNDQSIND
jgi:hypothetical protein